MTLVIMSSGCVEDYLYFWPLKKMKVCACVLEQTWGRGFVSFLLCRPRNRLQEQEKALDPPSASPSPNTPQWPNNQWLAESPVCHQISMLIAGGLTVAVPAQGTLGEIFQPGSSTVQSNVQGSSGYWTQNIRINTQPLFSLSYFTIISNVNIRWIATRE